MIESQAQERSITMIHYFSSRDNRPDAVSSAHWRDRSTGSLNAKRYAAMLALPPTHNLASRIQYYAIYPFHENSFLVAVASGNNQAHYRRNVE